MFISDGTAGCDGDVDDERVENKDEARMEMVAAMVI